MKDKDLLVQLEKVVVDKNLPIEERGEKFTQQIKTPCKFIVGKRVVILQFAESDITLQECMDDYFTGL